MTRLKDKCIIALDIHYESPSLSKRIGPSVWSFEVEQLFYKFMNSHPIQFQPVIEINCKFNEPCVKYELVPTGEFITTIEAVRDMCDDEESPFFLDMFIIKDGEGEQIEDKLAFIYDAE